MGLEVFSKDEVEVLDKMKEEEKITVEEYEKLVRLSKEQLKEYKEVDESLNKLEQNTKELQEKVEKKVELLKKYIEKNKSAESSEKKSDSIEEKVAQKKEELEKEAKKKMRKVADEKIPLVWGVLFDACSSMYDKIKNPDAGWGWKILGALSPVLLWWFSKLGVGDYEKTLNSVAKKAVEYKNSITSTISDTVWNAVAIIPSAKADVADSSDSSKYTGDIKKPEETTEEWEEKTDEKDWEKKWDEDEKSNKKTDEKLGETEEDKGDGENDENSEEKWGEKWTEQKEEESWESDEKNKWETEGDIEKIEKQAKGLYTLGMYSLLHFSQWLKGNAPDFNILSSLQDKNFSTLEKYKNAENSSLIKQLQSDENKAMLKSILKQKITKKTLEKNKEFLQQALGQEYESILESMQNNTYDPQKISIKAIGILTALSVKSVGLLSLDAIKDNLPTSEEVKQIFGEQFNALKNWLTERQEWLLSKDFLTKNASNFVHKGFNANNDLSWTGEEAEVKKFQEFTNFIVSPEFYENGKTFLVETKSVKEFKEELRYADIVALYTIFWGEPSLDDIGIFDLPVLYKLLSKIIKRHGSQNETYYLREVWRKLWDIPEDSPFAEEDKQALKVVAEQIGFDLTGVIIEKIKEWGGYAGLFKENPVVDGTVAIWGITTTVIASKLAQRGIIAQFVWRSMIGFGILWVFIGLSSLAYTCYQWRKKSNGGEFVTKLADFNLSQEQIENISEAEIEKLVQKAEEMNKNIYLKDINIDGKKEKALVYVGKKWLEVIYKGKLYILTTLEKIEDLWFWDTAKGIVRETRASEMMWKTSWSVKKWADQYISSDITSHIPDENIVTDFFKDTSKQISYWENKIDFSKIEIQGNKVFIDKNGKDGGLELNLDPILNKMITAKTEHPKKPLAPSEDNPYVSYKVLDENDGNKLVLLEQTDFLKAAEEQKQEQKA